MLTIMSGYTYKEMIPWDFLMEEYKNLKESIEIVEKLSQEGKGF
jgi:hypothetical protein